MRIGLDRFANSWKHEARSPLSCRYDLQRDARFSPRRYGISQRWLAAMEVIAQKP
jgi:hypothetical protein